MTESYTLEPGSEFRLRNGNAEKVDVEIALVDGSLIEFSLIRNSGFQISVGTGQAIQSVNTYIGGKNPDTDPRV